MQEINECCLISLQAIKDQINVNKHNRAKRFRSSRRRDEKKRKRPHLLSNPTEKPPITIQHLFNDSYVLHKRTISCC